MQLQNNKKYCVSTEFIIPIGHRLSKNKDKCFNLHGHNFKFVVTVCSRKLDSNDMVIDFRELKSLVREFQDLFDHALVICKHDEFLSNNKQVCDNFKVIKLEKDPTAEVLAEELYRFLSEKLKANENRKVEKIRVYESDKSFAEFSITS